MNLPPPYILYTPLSDEASAEIAEFLTQLALAFEETHLGQILRHRKSITPDPAEDPRQLSLFDFADDPF